MLLLYNGDSVIVEIVVVERFAGWSLVRALEVLAHCLLVIWSGEHLRNDYIIVLAKTEHIVTLVCGRAR